MSQVNRASPAVYTSIYMRCIFIAELSDFVVGLKAQEKRWQATKIRCWTDDDPDFTSEMMELLMCRTLMEDLDKYLARRVRMSRRKEEALQ
ncbi:hypothetical protein AC579_1390 [Pseudocercospora musae]|uniref:Uncharacterized protein n=1 Tax=Pseudocercospora musae TaxID=113226 RepID=A0A139IFX0_9PEZI|nr:hypothetical protein AC579_1390 [Pseudocercospora musae]